MSGDEPSSAADAWAWLRAPHPWETSAARARAHAAPPQVIAPLAGVRRARPEEEPAERRVLRAGSSGTDSGDSDSDDGDNDGGEAPLVCSAAEAARLMSLARTDVARSRDAAESLTTSGLSDYWRRLPIREAAQALHIAAGEREAANENRRSVVSCYSKFVADKGAHPYPMTADKVSAYLAYCVIVKRNKSGNLPDVLSHLRCAARFAGTPMSDDDDEQVKVHVKLLQTMAPSAKEKQRCLLPEEIQRVLVALDSERSAHALQAKALFVLLILFQSRGNELLDGNTQFRDITIEEWGIGRAQFLDKTRKDSLDVRNKVAPCVPFAFEGLCPKRALLQYLKATSQWDPSWARDPVKGKWPLFGKLVKKGAFTLTPAWSCSTRPLSSAEGKELLLPYFKAAGLLSPGAQGIKISYGRPTGSKFLQGICRVKKEASEATGGWAPTSTQSAHYADEPPSLLCASVHDEMLRGHWPHPLRFCCSPLLETRTIFPIQLPPAL